LESETISKIVLEREQLQKQIINRKVSEIETVSETKTVLET
jgi:hypothetical protein